MNKEKLLLHVEAFKVIETENLQYYEEMKNKAQKANSKSKILVKY